MSQPGSFSSNAVFGDGISTLLARGAETIA